MVVVVVSLLWPRLLDCCHSQGRLSMMYDCCYLIASSSLLLLNCSIWASCKSTTSLGNLTCTSGDRKKERKNIVDINVWAGQDFLSRGLLYLNHPRHRSEIASGFLRIFPRCESTRTISELT